MIVSCSTAPTKFDIYESGRWQSRALIKDKRQVKSYVVNIDIIAAKPNKLRMDITSTIGGHLSSLAMNEGILQYIIVKEKKYFSGKANAQAMKNLVGLHLKPKNFVNLLFDIEPQGKAWQCTKDEIHLLKECINKSSDIKVSWAKRIRQSRNIIIESKSSKVQLSLKNFEPNIIPKMHSFEIKKP